MSVLLPVRGALVVGNGSAKNEEAWLPLRVLSSTLVQRRRYFHVANGTRQRSFAT